ncbi:MAG: transposase [Ktedonobacteraceae bacterium]
MSPVRMLKRWLCACLGVGPHTERRVRALQQFIGEGRWHDEAILAEHQRLVNETLGEEDGVLIVNGSDFPKHGDHSAGVARETVRKPRQER